MLGYAFGGKVKHLQLGVLDQDRGLPAIKLREMARPVAANARTFETVYYDDQAAALRDLREGKINGLLNIPPHFRARSWPGPTRASPWWKTTPTNSPPPPWKAR